jgi:hypothetical protein
MEKAITSRHPKPSSQNAAGDFDRFTNFMKRLVAVPHSEIKAKLDAEKRAKKRKKAKKSSASRAQV